MSKGSKQRPTDKAAYDRNYDAIFRKEKKTAPWGYSTWRLNNDGTVTKVEKRKEQE
jgi:hypothetical protein